MSELLVTRYHAAARGLPAGEPQIRTMIRLIAAGACALFLIGCSAEPAGNTGGQSTPALSVATDTSAKFELGKDI